MKVLRQRINRKGKREVVVELEAKDKLVAFQEDRHYRLGGQVEDIVAGHVILEASHTYWCSVAQEWVQ